MPFTDMTGVVFAPGEPYFDHLMTQWYEPLVVDARNNAAVLWNLINRGKRNVYGKRVTMPVRNGRNFGIGAIQPGGHFPDSGKQGAQQYTFPIRHVFARAKMDGATLDSVRGNNAAYLEAVDWEIQGLTDDFIQQQQRMIYGDGSGRMAEVAAIGSTSGVQRTITLRTNQGLASPTTDTTPPTRWFIAGQYIAVMTSVAGNVRLGVVDSIDTDTTITVTFATSTTVAVGDWVCFAASNTSSYTKTDTAYRAEPMGIGGVYQTGNVADGNGLQITGAPQEGSEGDETAGGVGFQGQNSTDQTYNQGLVFGNSGTARTLTEALMQTAVSDIERINNGKVDFILSYHDIYDTYVNSLISEKRFQTTELRGGHTSILFNDIPFVKDKDCTRNRIFLMDLDCFYCHENTPFQIVNDDGRTWRMADDTDDMQIVFKNRYTFSVAVRNRAGGVLTDLT